MSLSLLNNNRRKPWLNPRMENIKIDGNLNCSRIGYVDEKQETFTSFILDAGTNVYKKIFSVDNVKANDNNKPYEVYFTADLEYNKSGGSNCRLRLRIERVSDGTSIYTGQEVLYNGQQGEKNGLCLIDRANANNNGDVNIIVEAATNAASDFPIMLVARCLFKTVL